MPTIAGMIESRWFRISLLVAYLAMLGVSLWLEVSAQIDVYQQRGQFGYFTGSTLWTLLLVLLPVVWLLRGMAGDIVGLVRPAGRLVRSNVAFSLLAFAIPVAIGVGLHVHYFAEYEPEDIHFHDEWSYLFQAKTYLAGRMSYPSPPSPEHFDSFHIVNQGRMASRYFPGTGVVLMPFVAAGVPWLAGVVLTGLTAVLVFWIGMELGDRIAAQVAAIVCGLSMTILTFGQIIDAHLPTTVPLLFGVLFFLRTLRSGRLIHPVLAGVGLAAAMLVRPLTAFGVVLIPAAWLAVRVVAKWEPRGWAKLGAMGAPVVVGLLMLGAGNWAVTGNPLLPPYLQYTETYTPRHRWGFNNGTRAEEQERIAASQGRSAFPRRDRNVQFVKYDKDWTADLDLPTAVEKSRHRLMGMCWGTLGLGFCAGALLVFVLNLPRCGPGDRLVLGGIVGLHAIHFPFAFDGIDYVSYVFESVPLLCLVVGRVAAAAGRNRPWLAVWLAVALGGLAAENVLIKTTGWCANAAITKTYYKAFRQKLDARLAEQGGTGDVLVFIEPEKDDLHRALVINEPGLQGRILRAWHLAGAADRFEADRECAGRFPERRAFYVRCVLDRGTLPHRIVDVQVFPLSPLTPR